MNKFILQLSLKNYQLERYIKALKKVNAEYSFFSVFSDINQVANFPEDFASEDYLALAGIKAVKISLDPKEENFTDKNDFVMFAQQEKKYQNAFFYQNKDNFDQLHYNKMNLPLLNQASQFLEIKDNLKTTFKTDMFIKPSSDLKGFTAGIIKSGTTVEDHIFTTSRQECWLEETLLISPLVNIHSEYRFFIVDKNILAYSQYKENNEVIIKNSIPDNVMKKAQEYVKLYQPDDGFVMDLALLENGDVKIVEYNCFNGSGTYAADLTTMFDYLKSRQNNNHIKLKKPM